MEPPREEDVPPLSEIAVEIAAVSRFSFDRHFPVDAAPRLYRAWLQAALDNPNDKVIVARSPQGVVGLLTCGLTHHRETGVIKLVGVSHRTRGVGVGAALVEECLNWLQAEGATRVEVTTQARNVAAQRLYQKMGFLLFRSALHYHKWLG
jgi:ribosomal protein S18 acetylase RimI-like enzyme